MLASKTGCAFAFPIHGMDGAMGLKNQFSLGVYLLEERWAR